jgi:hypothetical protein
MENQTQYFNHGPNRAYIVRPDGTATYYADWQGFDKQEINHFDSNVLKGMKGLEPCTLEQFTEIKWRVIRKMTERGAI